VLSPSMSVASAFVPVTEGAGSKQRDPTFDHCRFQASEEEQLSRYVSADIQTLKGSSVASLWPKGAGTRTLSEMLADSLSVLAIGPKEQGSQSQRLGRLAAT
jgi:hypothetical protein